MACTVISFAILTEVGRLLVRDLLRDNLSLAIGTRASQVEHLVLIRFELNNASVHHKEMRLVHIV